MAERRADVSCEGDDPVVFEAPVFLSKMLEEKLIILQHPNRPKNASLDNPVLKSRIKPNHQEVELVIELDTASPNYHDKVGKDIASQVDGTPEEIERRGFRHYQSGLMDTQVLRSGTINPKLPATYAVGKFQNGELHICPVESIVELQPTFAYREIMYRRDQQKISENKDKEGGEVPSHRVCVKFARQESERSKKMKKMTYSYYMKKRAEEKWINTQYFPVGSEESEVEKTKMICPHPRLEVRGLNKKPEDYLKALVPYKPSKNIAIPSTWGLVSVASLKKMYWREKVQTLLLSAKVMQFGKLVSLLSDEKKPKEVNILLRALQTQAVMVRGNWIVKSEVMYPMNTESRYNGVPSAVMCRARDYLLLLFQQYQYVGQVKFVNRVKIPREEAKEMLTEIATYHKSKGWDLLYPYDSDFIQRYPEVARHQQMFWEEKRRCLESAFKDMGQPCKNAKANRRQSKKFCRKSSPGNESGGEGCSVRHRKKSVLVEAAK